MATPASAMKELFCPGTSLFVPDRDIPDLSGFVAAVTGGYTGIGLETVRHLLKHNATVFVLGRSPAKAEQAFQTLREEDTSYSTRINFVQLDLSDLESVRKAADNLSNRTAHLDILFNNAGVMFCPAKLESPQGYDLQWATNTLGHYFLTKCLLPTLLASPNRSAGFPRVVTTSSGSHVIATVPEGVRFSALERNGAQPELSTQVLYGVSKLGNILVAKQFHKRYVSAGLVSTACAPGYIKSELDRNMDRSTMIIDMLLSPWRKDVSYGALTQLWLGTTEECKSNGGEYGVPWAKIGLPSARALDEELGDKVWEWLEEKTKGF